MARIKEEVIEKLKREINLAELVRSQGIELTGSGENLIGRCPLHDDKTPSLVITPAKNLWHCLGACAVGGSVIDWVMKTQKVSFRHAVEILLSHESLSLVAQKDKPTELKLELPISVGSEGTELLNDVIEYYHSTLLKSPEALEYLKKRGIFNEEAIKKFKIGFSNRTLGLRLPESRNVEGSVLRSQLQEVGILRASGHEHFSGSLVIPIFDESNHVTEIYGRKITEKLREGTSYHTYLPGPHKGLWNFEGITSDEVILCESLIDALSFWVNGFRNVTASYGVEGFTKDHFFYFEKLGIKKVIIAYDRDEAGDKAAEKLSLKLKAVGIGSSRLKFPKQMDANEYILKVRPADQALKVLIDACGGIREKKITPSPEELSNELQIKQSPSTVETVPVFKKELPELAQGADLHSIEVQVIDENIFFRLETREYRVRGLKKNLSLESLKVSLRLFFEGRQFIDSIDFYQARQRSGFTVAAAHETKIKEEVIKVDLGKILIKLEELQDLEIRTRLQSEKKHKEVILSGMETEEALLSLKSPDLLKNILADFAKAGVVGEESNLLVSYLAACSRLLDEPLAVIIQSASSAGKSNLMEAVLAMMPEEDRVKYSAMTGQSLFYMGETDLKNKILAISEEQGVMSSSYALKLLQSEGEISIASTGKNSQTGKLTTHEYRVEGPVMIFLTTTSVEVDEELLNRSVVLTVNESREQTRLIHDRQRKGQTIEGLFLKQEKSEILRRHKNMQRLLKPLLVANPYAEQLTFLDSRTRTRRDHVKYLTLIKTITLLHQHQRELKTKTFGDKEIEFIEVEKSDIEVANRLCHQVLGRSLDELAPQARKLLNYLSQMTKVMMDQSGESLRDLRFTRKMVRDFTNWSDFQVGVHMERLVRLEYVLVHRGGRGQSFVYELIYDGSDTSESVLPGLIDVGALTKERRTPLTQELMGQSESIEGSSGVVQGRFEGAQNASGNQSSIGSPERIPSFKKKEVIQVEDNPEIIVARKRDAV